MSSNSQLLSFERLRGRENYDVWCKQVKSYLIIKNLWSSVSNGITDKSTPAEKDVDEKALAELTLMIEPYNFGHIANAQTAKCAWYALETAFQSKGLTRKVELLKTLVKMRLVDFGSMQDYVNTFITISFQCRNSGLQLDDDLLASLMLAGLPEECVSLVLAIENSNTKLSIDTIKTTLLQDRKFDKDVKNDTALYVKNKEKQIRCHICNEPNHLARYCTARKYKKYESKTKQTKTNDTVLHAAMHATEIKSTDWYIDSGASAHMTMNKDYFNTEVVCENSDITIANNNRLRVLSSGNVSVHLGKMQATLTNVKCVPNLCTNLISVSQMAKNGNRIVFENKVCNIFNKQSQLIATAEMENDLYRLNCNVISTKNNIALITADKQNIWHRRMGHICNENLLKVKNATIGIKTIASVENNCKICAMGKQTRASFKEKGSRASELLEIIHSDVCVPTSTESHAGAKYFVTFTDDFSRYCTVVPIKSKSQVFNEFIKFKNMAERQCAKKLKCSGQTTAPSFAMQNLKNSFKTKE